MAIALVPRFVQEIKLDNISPQHWIILAIITAQKQGWQLRFYSSNGLIAFMQVGSQTYQLTATIKDDSVTIESKTANGHMADLGKNKKNVASFITGIEIEQKAYTSEQLDELYIQVSINFPPAEADAILQLKNAPKEKPINLLSIFVPRKGFWITPLLIDINVLVFILMTAMGGDIYSPSGNILLKWGANYQPLTLNGEWWRLITCCFVHIGILHLFMNMFALLFIGILLEGKLGRLRFLTAYILTGITASVTSAYWHDLNLSAGASGAIFGMYGVFLAMLTTNLIPKPERKTQLVSIIIFVVYNLAGGLKAGIDNAAHIGGLLGGMFIGYVFYASLKNKGSRTLQMGSILLVSVVVLVGAFFVLRSIPHHF